MDLKWKWNRHNWTSSFNLTKNFWENTQIFLVIFNWKLSIYPDSLSRSITVHIIKAWGPVNWTLIHRTAAEPFVLSNKFILHKSTVIYKTFVKKFILETVHKYNKWRLKPCQAYNERQQYYNQCSRLCPDVADKGSLRVKLKVKQSHFRPGQTLRFPGIWYSYTARQTPNESGKIYQPYTLAAIIPGNIHGTNFC